MGSEHDTEISLVVDALGIGSKQSSNLTFIDHDATNVNSVIFIDSKKLQKTGPKRDP